MTGPIRDDAIARLLEAAEARFRDLIDHNVDGVVVVDQNGVIQYVNPAAEILLGRWQPELFGQPFGIPLVPGEITEIDLPRADGSYRIAEMRAARTEWHGQVVLLCTVRDVTERHTTEETLFLRQREFRLLIENAPDPILRFSPDLKVRFVNPATLRSLRLTTNDLLGRRLGDLDLPADLVAVLDSNLREAFKSGEERTIEFDVPGRLQARHFHGRVVPERDPNDAVESVLLVARDISDRKRLETELRKRIDALAEADLRKDQFLAMLSHELRNPLMPILNAARVLRMRQGQDTREAMLTIIEQQALHMTRLVDDLLNVSRIIHGKVQLQKRVMDLVHAATTAIETVRPALERQAHALHLALPAAPLWIEADPSRIDQVLTNLLSNAIKYTQAGGSIWLTIAEEDGHAVVRVRDNGVGIDQAWLPRVFDLFSQVDSSLDRSQGGLGIGLTLVKDLVQLHGGTVEAQSPGLGRGSEFVARFPRLDGLAEPGPPNRLAEGVRPAPGQSLRILVVDDNAAGLESLMMLIALWGHHPTAARDGQEALVLAARERPDAVLLDIGLPGLDGYRVARELRRRDATRPALLVAMTGYGQEDDRRIALEAGFDHHMVKPIDLEVLEDLLAGASLGRARDGQGA